MDQEEEKERWEETLLPESSVQGDMIKEVQYQVGLIAAADSVFMDDWKAAYATSTWWSPRWNACHTAGAGWPEGVQLRGDDKQFMYLHGKLCVPEGLLLKLVSQWHS